MKSTFANFAIISCFVLLCSCTHTLYTHQQVLQGQRTRDDVLKQFGKPDDINAGPGFEQWTYNMDKGPRKQDTAKSIPDTIVKDSVQRITQEKYTRYVEFMFDEQGKVVGYKADGVDLSRKVKDNFGKSALNITGGILILSVVVALELYKDGAFDN